METLDIFNTDRHGDVNPFGPSDIPRFAVAAAHADRSECPTTDELVDYADGQILDKDRLEELAEHERRCLVCRKELRALRRMNDELEIEFPDFRRMNDEPEIEF
jgi:hypothetical protein